MNTTSLHRTLSAIQYKKNYENKIWAVIGRTTPWPNEAAPPTVDPETTSVTEPIGAVKCNIVRWVQSATGSGDYSLVYTNASNQLVTTYWSDVLTEGSVIASKIRHIVFSATIIGPSLPAGEFRQVGFFADLVPAAGFTEAAVVLPDQIASYGHLVFLNNQTPTTRSQSYNYTALAVVEF